MNYQVSEFTLGSIGQHGSGNINFQPKGYWSGNTISVYIRRNCFTAEGGWQANVSHSSGGRDTNEVETDMEAVKYFAEALLAASKCAEEIIAKADELEAAYQLQKSKYHEEYLAERAAKEKRIAEDAPFGEEAARELIMQICDTTRSGSTQRINVYERGSETKNQIIISRRINVKLQLRGSSISRAAAISALAASSHRSHLVTTE